jgi:hypothetical protein
MRQVMNISTVNALHTSAETKRDGLHFLPEDLGQLQALGHSVRLEFRKTWLRIDAAALARHPLSQGEFLVMLSDMSSHAPQHLALQAEPDTTKLLILRVEDWERVPLRNTDTSENFLRCAILGSFNKDLLDEQAPWAFTSQISVHMNAESFKAFVPSPQVLQGLVNGTLRTKGLLDFGKLRYNEQIDWRKHAISTRIGMYDMVGKRSAMLGKTRLGKSNIVKLIAQGILDYTRETNNVGQLLFDVSGEYSNTNPTNGEITLASHNKERCTSYFLTARQGNKDGRLLRFNFYQTPTQALEVMQELLPPQVVELPSVRSFLTCRLSNMVFDEHDTETSKHKQLRKIMLYWAVLDAGGFPYDAERTKAWLLSLGFAAPFNPSFSANLRQAAYQAIHNTPAVAVPSTMAALLVEINTIARFRQIYTNDPNLMVQGRPLFDSEEVILMNFLCSEEGGSGSQGPSQLRTCLPYHSAIAEDFIHQILTSLNLGRTVIIDLSNALERVVQFFAEKLCLAIFAEQEHKFNQNALTGRYVQIYFEEAHTIFPMQGTLMTNVYARFAKEGAKFHIGIAYATQSPSTINPDLLAQTENFFIGHLSSQKEVNCLSEMQVAFQGCENAIRFNRTPGLILMLTQSHRYVVPMQAHLYDGRSLMLS